MHKYIYNWIYSTATNRTGYIFMIDDTVVISYDGSINQYDASSFHLLDLDFMDFFISHEEQSSSN